jgi:hypothetical protein
MSQRYDEETIEKSLDDAVAFVLAQAEYHCPPEDGREEWDPQEFDLIEQLLRGTWPVRIPVVYELFFDGEAIQMRSCTLDPPPPEGCRRRLVPALLACDREPMRELLERSVLGQCEQGETNVASLLLLANAHSEAFFRTAANFFAGLLAPGRPDLARDSPFVGFVVLLEERAEGLLVPLIEQAIDMDGAAGWRLREAALSVLNEPWVCDRLGWLRAGELIEALELL